MGGGPESLPHMEDMPPSIEIGSCKSQKHSEAERGPEVSKPRKSHRPTMFHVIILVERVLTIARRCQGYTGPLFSDRPNPSRLKLSMSRVSLRVQIALAFLAIYTIWGSTYLAIRIAIETIPPFLMAGIRFLIAGIALYLWTRLRGAPTPTRHNWKAATIIGGLLLLGGNGGVVWAEQHVPSGLTAVLITTVPLWMALLEWRRYDRVRPASPIVFGLILGFAGVVLLVGPEELAGSGAIDRIGATVLILASLSWAIGSLYSRRATLPSSPLQSTAMEMISGGALLMLAAAAGQEWVGFQPSAASLRSLVAFTYLVIFGSLIGFTSYIFLLKATAAAKVSTYAYINPIIAVILGWAIAAEELTLRTLIAAAIIVAAVVVITTYRATVNHAVKTASIVKAVQPQLTEKQGPLREAQLERAE